MQGGAALKFLDVYSLAVKISGTCSNQCTYFLPPECKCV